LPAELLLRLVDGDKRILGRRLVDPLVEGRDAEAVERVQGQDRRGGREADDPLAVTARSSTAW
jgi:hypothetical protein